MKKNNKRYKNLSIVALILGIICLTIGFAAFSSTLIIYSNANVSPNKNTLNVNFSSSETKITTDDIIPIKSPSTITATNATINNSGDPTITGLSAVFTEPGQSATYTFYARNDGRYAAFLKNIVYENVSGEASPRICIAGENSNDSLVQAACDDIILSIKVGDENEVTGSKISITNHVLEKNTAEKITVKIEYKANGDEADGPFSVKFGDVILIYSSID